MFLPKVSSNFEAKRSSLVYIERLWWGEKLEKRKRAARLNTSEALAIKHNLDSRCVDTRKKRKKNLEKKRLLMCLMQVARQRNGLNTLLTRSREESQGLQLNFDTLNSIVPLVQLNEIELKPFNEKTQLLSMFERCWNHRKFASNTRTRIQSSETKREWIID